MLKVKLARVFRGVESVGILDDGSLFIDSHWFDDDQGDAASTDYVSVRHVPAINNLLTTPERMPSSNEQLLAALAERFTSSAEIVEWLKKNAIPTVHRFDDGAWYDVATSMPEGDT
jgi:hypothetical protein